MSEGVGVLFEGTTEQVAVYALDERADWCVVEAEGIIVFKIREGIL